MADDPGRIDHYVWEGYYIPDHWDSPMGEVYASTKETAMELVADEADVPNAGWEEDDRCDEPTFQLHRTTHHIVTVRRIPVYGDHDE